jgi:hypothetical protein
MARRGLVAAEFEQMLDLLEETNNIRKKYMVSNAARSQYPMVARIDDTANFKEADLKPNPRFDFALLAQMCWSKNVMEERDAPDQILLGWMDFRYCILLGLGIYLEVWLEAGKGIGNEYLFGHAESAKTNKNYIRKSMEEIFVDPRFVRIILGLLGSHSNHKYPTTKLDNVGARRTISKIVADGARDEFQADTLMSVFPISRCKGCSCTVYWRTCQVCSQGRIRREYLVAACTCCTAYDCQRTHSRRSCSRATSLANSMGLF